MYIKNKTHSLKHFYFCPVENSFSNILFLFLTSRSYNDEPKIENEILNLFGI